MFALRWSFVLPLLLALRTEAADPSVATGELYVDPPSVRLVHVRQPHALVVTLKTKLGETVDLTTDAKYASDDETIARVTTDGWIEPVADGTTEVRVAVAGKTATVKIVVDLPDHAQPYSFRNDVMPVLSKAGCNQGACHGYSLGKNGFKLSLRGADPDADFLALTDEFYERRINRHNPLASLLVTKPLGDAPHKGGVRLERNGELHRLLLGWIAAGAPAEPADGPKFSSLRIFPEKVVMRPGKRQQLQVVATYDDGSQRDVTRLSIFTPNAEQIATVDENGRVSAVQLGETAVSARFERTFVTAEFIVLMPNDKFKPTPVPTDNLIDRFVAEKLNALNIAPSDLASDEQFLRRAYLDLIGIQPTPDELRQFVADKGPKKRDRVIDALIARPEFVDQWSLKWGDLLQNTRNRLSEPAVYAFREWIRSAVDANLPLDEFVREILLSQGGSSESPTSAFYLVSQDPHDTMQRTTQVFCGVRMLCAKCHAHPFENWTQEDYFGLYNFFNQVTAKNDPRAMGVTNAKTVLVNRTAALEKHPRTGRPQPPRYLGGEEPRLAAAVDRREAYAHWLTSRENPFFARSMANRIWSYFFHRGIIDPVDDLRSTNPPINPALLDALTADFVAHGFDVRYLMRLIVTSRTYQLSSQMNETNVHDDANFSHCIPRRLSAESLLDCLVQATGVAEKFAGAPAGFSARQLPDANVQSEFLKLFGKPQRMEACECERDDGSNMLQALYFINGDPILGRIGSPKSRIAQLVKQESGDDALIEQLYLWSVCRNPSNAEKKLAREHFKSYEGRRLDAAQDFTWALLNSRDFMLVH
ncbi:MAG TPA: DUF1549 domain-containing protein [Pirellulales bacterium]|jgi:hypothetical protein|nr:DUF1549 domain-containing protein [Pirellulales bacterium]